MRFLPFAKASLWLSISSVAFAVTANATNDQEQFENVVIAGEQITQSAANSQQKINKYTEQTQTKLQQFNVLAKEVDGLAVYNQQMQAQLNNQLTELAQLAKSMNDVSIIERQISPLMARMIATLEKFVALDVPFLPEERTKRVNDLSSMMQRADISVSEKFRRVLEAYQIEVDYGRTIEAYSGLLTIKGQEMDVDFLRIGRVSLVYQTRDGSQLGQWAQGQTNKKGQWQSLS